MEVHRDFDLKKAFLKGKTVKTVFTDWLQDGVTETHTIERPVSPHRDLTDVWDSFVPYLLRSQGHYLIYDEASKYLKGEKMQKIENKMQELISGTVITAVEIDGKGDLKGVVIKGKVKTFQNQMKAIKTPKIVFSEDIIGIETDLAGQCELLEQEIKNYLYNNKKGEDDLFGKEPNERGEEVPNEMAAVS